MKSGGVYRGVSVKIPNPSQIDSARDTAHVFHILELTNASSWNSYPQHLGMVKG